MRELCRVPAKALDSTLKLRGMTPPVTSPITQPGSSGMVDTTFSQAALNEVAKAEQCLKRYIADKYAPKRKVQDIRCNRDR
jgi:hypothetical protein